MLMQKATKKKKKHHVETSININCLKLLLKFSNRKNKSTNFQNQMKVKKI